jgi:hypothetical protein
MRGWVGRRNTKRSRAADPLSGTLGRVGGLLGRQEEETKRTRTSYSGSVGLGVGALLVVATISLVLILRRRAARQGSPIEETNEETNGPA